MNVAMKGLKGFEQKCPKMSQNRVLRKPSPVAEQPDKSKKRNKSGGKAPHSK
jgi:hypothetical protein